MPVEQLSATTSDGRSIALWRSAPVGSTQGPVVVMSAGFARRMRHVGAVALCLVRNGVTVYRYDGLDHIGLGDGEMHDFTASSALDSLRTAVAFAVDREPVESVTVVAASLTARGAIRICAEGAPVERVVMLVGVVNASDTLKRVLGSDLVDAPTDDLPDEVVADGYAIGARPFARDARANGWTGLQGTIDELRRVDVPVYNFYGVDDGWVDGEDVERAFREGDGGPRLLFELPDGKHDLGRNPASLRHALTRVTAAVLGAYESDGDPDAFAEAVDYPAFGEIVALAISEGKLERSAKEAERAS